MRYFKPSARAFAAGEECAIGPSPSIVSDGRPGPLWMLAPSSGQSRPELGTLATARRSSPIRQNSLVETPIGPNYPCHIPAVASDVRREDGSNAGGIFRGGALLAGGSG